MLWQEFMHLGIFWCYIICLQNELIYVYIKLCKDNTDGFCKFGARTMWFEHLNQQHGNILCSVHPLYSDICISISSLSHRQCRVKVGIVLVSRGHLGRRWGALKYGYIKKENTLQYNKNMKTTNNRKHGESHLLN